MCSGAGLAASGMGRVSGMCVAGCLLVVALGIVVFIRLMPCVGEGCSA